MTTQHYDLIVVGLGAMGSAALYQASKRGASALGIDRFTPPHTMGSSHGDTRITRNAIGEGENYMPFVKRSNEIWRELEAATGNSPPASERRSHYRRGKCRRLSIIKATSSTNPPASPRNSASPMRFSAPTNCGERFPLLLPRDSDRAYYEPGAGVLRPERCIAAQLELARQNEAVIHTGERVTGYEMGASGCDCRQQRKSSYSADKLILSAGAWIADFLPETSSRLASASIVS